MNYQEAARELKGALRLRTEPLGVAFLREAAALPEKTRRPSQVLGKRVTICQGVTMARVYGWSVGLTAEDLICVPGMLAFGLAPEPYPGQELVSLLCDVGFHADKEAARKEAEVLSRIGPKEIEALYLAPLERITRDPDVVAVYGNPAQLMRLIQGAVFGLGERVQGDFGGKVECSSYLIGPWKTGQVRVVMPGMGDRIFSMTQDDELVVSFPVRLLEASSKAWRKRARKSGPAIPSPFTRIFSRNSPSPTRNGQKNGESCRIDLRVSRASLPALVRSIERISFGIKTYSTASIRRAVSAAGPGRPGGRIPGRALLAGGMGRGRGGSAVWG